MCWKMAPVLRHRKVLFYLLIVRLASVFVVRTHFVPDEYWQSLEVAHRMTFGYGYLTWEWTSGIRNCLYPALFALLYKVLQVFNLDYSILLIMLPRVVQAVFTAIGESFTVRLCQRTFGDAAAYWTFLALLASWFQFYCGSRTLTNSMEAALTSLALYHYPWPTDASQWGGGVPDGTADRRNDKKLRHRTATSAGPTSSVIWFLNVAAVSVIIRPTSMVVWLPLCARHMYLNWDQLATWKLYSMVGLYSLSAMLLLDRLFYGEWISTLYNFVRFNVIDGSSSYFGTHPFHWYWTQGFPVIMATHLLPFIMEAAHSWRSPMFALIMWQLLAYSFIPHKEFRFILPVLPISMCLVGKYLASIERRPRKFVNKIWNAKVVYGFLIVTNLAMVLPLSTMHMRAPLSIIQHVAALPQPDANLSILFLTPCHTTPLYSHLHRNISTRFLTCHPNVYNVRNFSVESEDFYENPLAFLQQQYGQNKSAHRFPTHIVMYDALVKTLVPFLKVNSFKLCAEYFHSYITEGRQSEYLQLYCKVN